MTTDAGNEETQRKHAYEHVLRSLHSAYDVLIECSLEIDDIHLDASRNRRDINLILGWVHDTCARIYEAYPELSPPVSEPPPRRWPADTGKSAAPDRLTREGALSRVQHHLELVRLILQECGPFARKLGITSGALEEQLAKVNDIHTAVVQEIWSDLPDRGRRSWIRDWGMPEGLPEPPPPDRHEALGRLNDKLDAAAKVLGDCAQLIVDLELQPQLHLRAIGSCLATIFDIQQQVYGERPDLIPGFLKGAYDLRRQEEQGRPETGAES
jgi:hypothetical protein